MTNSIAFLILIVTFFNNVQFRGVEAQDPPVQNDSEDVLTVETNNDVSRLNVFLTGIRNDQDVLKRKVFVDDKELSIHDYFNPPDSADSSNEWSISKKNVYDLSHLMNIVMSCEYSDITYYYIILIDKYFKRCIDELKSDLSLNPKEKLSKINEYFETYKSELLDKILNQISPMILSLTSFMKLTKNPMTRYHEMLTILLSWYAYMYENNKDSIISNSYADGMLLLDSIMITNAQMIYRLERFMIKSCYHYIELTNYKNKVDTDTTNMNNSTYDNFFKDKEAKLKYVILPNVEFNSSSLKKFVINTIDSDFNTLIGIIYNEVGHTKIEIDWNDNIKDLKNIFEYEIKTSTNIEKILSYERVLIHVIEELVLLHEIKVLLHIKTSDEIRNEDKGTQCHELLQKIKGFSNLLKDQKQPIGLVNAILTLSNNLNIVCSYMQDFLSNIDTVTKYITDLVKSSSSALKKLESYTTIDELFSSLSNVLICSKLHPVISNIFWEELRNSFPRERIFGNKYQYLNTAYKNKPVNNTMGNKTLNLLDKLSTIETLLDTSIQTDENNKTLTTNYSCFASFNELYNSVIVDVANIIINSSPYSDDWAAMLVILLYNQRAIELFQPKKQDSLNYTHIRRLIRFISNMKILLLEKQYVHCSCGVFSDLNAIGSCPDGQNESKWNENIQTIDDIVPVMQGLNKSVNYSHAMNVVMEEYLSKLEPQNVQFKFYWDGTEKSIPEIINMFKWYTVDIEDSYDNENLVAKFVIAIAYTGLMGIFDGVIHSRIKPHSTEESALAEIASDFKKIPLMFSTPVGYLLPDIIFGINEFDSNNDEPSIQSKLGVRIRSQFLGLVEDSLPNTNDTDVSKLITQFLSKASITIKMFTEDSE